MTPVDALALWASIGVGAVIVFAGLVDVFQTLLRSDSSGWMSRRLIRAIWRLSSRLGPRLLRNSGPVSLVAATALWAVTQALGWALIYWPFVRTGLSGGSPEAVARPLTDLASATYFSLVTLSTLGYGDLVPTTAMLRLIAPLEAITGFILLTAAISWFLQIHPALSRRRALALQLDGLSASGFVARLHALEPGAVCQKIDDITTDITEVRVALTHSPETYYFRDATMRESFASTIAVAIDLADAASASEHPTVRQFGRLLEYALSDLASLLAREFGHVGDTMPQILRSYAVAHARASGQREGDPFPLGTASER